MSGLTNVDNILIQQSPYEAIQFVSGSNISNVQINNATIQNTGTFVVQEQVGGAATITNSTATGTQGQFSIYNCGVGFTLTDGGGNSGVFTSTGCNANFVPTFPPYLPDNGSLISISPTAVGFGTVATGSSSAPQAVTVTNSGTAAAPVSGAAPSKHPPPTIYKRGQTTFNRRFFQCQIAKSKTAASSETPSGQYSSRRAS
jgi:hypothetical protein